MTKNYKAAIGQKLLNSLLEQCSMSSIEVELFEGSLLDQYIIHADKRITIKGIKPRQYILIYEQYVNPWRSENIACFSDDENLADKLRAAATA